MRAEVKIPTHSDAQRILFGQNDAHLRMLRAELGIKFTPRGEKMILEGDESHVLQGVNILERMIESVGSGQEGLAEELALLLELSGEDDEQRASGTVYVDRRKITARTEGQRTYISAIRDNDLVFGVGPAGTGKTYLAVACAIEALRHGSVKRIILARPAVEAGESLGFLPGDMQEKVDPYLRPIYDALDDMLSRRQLAHYQETNVLEVAPLAFMRGRTLHRSFMILDEAQNTTPGQMKMFLTRMGMQSKCVVTGDLTQVDLQTEKQSGLAHASQTLGGLSGVSVMRLQQDDIVRHRLVRSIVGAYEEEERADQALPRVEG